MLIKKIVRYISGQIKFTLKSNNPEEFLNQCIKNKIHLSKISMSKYVLTAECSVDSYRKLQKIKLNKARRKIIKKYGIRFVVNRYRKRWGLVAGAALMVVLLIYLSGFVWSVDVSGNNRLSQNVILQTLEECGFKNGVKKSKINITSIENEMKSRLYDLSWISINLDGSSAHVEVKERRVIPGMDSDNKPSNLVASTDGKIIRMEITKGKPIAMVGSGVVKGELLVSGLYNDKKDNVILEHSRGKVTAEVSISKEFVQSRNGIEKVGTESKTLYAFEAFCKEIPLHFEKKPKGSEWKCQTQENVVKIFGLKFPFKVIKYNFSKALTKEIILDDASVKDRLNLQIEHFESENFSEGKIIEKNVEFHSDNRQITAVVDYVVHIDIAKQQYIETED